jgi:uncharacterized protein (DUF111 family)
VILYLDCLRGVNAVSALAALIDAGVTADAIVDRLRTLPGTIELTTSETLVEDLRARRIELRVHEVSDAKCLEDAVKLIETADLSHETRGRLARIYERLASAEATVHGSTPDAVTFHEIGRARSVVAVVAFGAAIELLDVRDVIASPLVVGGGFVDTHHGRLAVPAPATLEILRRVPVRQGVGDGELVTPTGAAIVVELASSFGPMPSMTVEGIGYGVDDSRPRSVTRVVAGTRG